MAWQASIINLYYMKTLNHSNLSCLAPFSTYHLMPRAKPSEMLLALLCRQRESNPGRQHSKLVRYRQWLNSLSLISRTIKLWWTNKEIYASQRINRFKDSKFVFLSKFWMNLHKINFFCFEIWTWRQNRSFLMNWINFWWWWGWGGKRK